MQWGSGRTCSNSGWERRQSTDGLRNGWFALPCHGAAFFKKCEIGTSFRSPQKSILPIWNRREEQPSSLEISLTASEDENSLISIDSASQPVLSPSTINQETMFFHLQFGYFLNNIPAQFSSALICSLIVASCYLLLLLDFLFHCLHQYLFSEFDSFKEGKK